eukprot:Clim_evm9s212 gene=Clim_evmTU9s212
MRSVLQQYVSFVVNDPWPQPYGEHFQTESSIPCRPRPLYRRRDGNNASADDWLSVARKMASDINIHVVSDLHSLPLVQSWASKKGIRVRNMRCNYNWHVPSDTDVYRGSGLTLRDALVVHRYLRAGGHRSSPSSPLRSTVGNFKSVILINSFTDIDPTSYTMPVLKPFTECGPYDVIVGKCKCHGSICMIAIGDTLLEHIDDRVRQGSKELDIDADDPFIFESTIHDLVKEHGGYAEEHSLPTYCDHVQATRGSASSATFTERRPIRHAANARVGLLGNPSDGFGGATLAMTIAQFWAEALLVPRPHGVHLIAHPHHDHRIHAYLDDLTEGDEEEEEQSRLEKDDNGSDSVTGETGKRSASPTNANNGLRLLQATCKVFYRACKTLKIPLASTSEEGCGFALSYDTQVPRQMGLAGSSAIITATWRCLMEFFGVTEVQMPKPIQANMIRSVEMDELGIQCGLQDRVAQVYQGLVMMDFNAEIVNRQGFGYYESLLNEELVVDHPKNRHNAFFIAYYPSPELTQQPSSLKLSREASSSSQELDVNGEKSSAEGGSGGVGVSGADETAMESGQVHSSVAERFAEGDENVIAVMHELAQLTHQGKQALSERRYSEFGRLMERNFALRSKIYGEAVLGSANLAMIRVARMLDIPAKYPGSGGAILGYCSDDAKVSELRRRLRQIGAVVVRIDCSVRRNYTFGIDDGVAATR